MHASTSRRSTSRSRSSGRDSWRARSRSARGAPLALPYPDASFDALWCANAVQYLSHEDLSRALAEMVRVVRPGGLVAVKEFGVGPITIRPGPGILVSDFFRAAGHQAGVRRAAAARRRLGRRRGRGWTWTPGAPSPTPTTPPTRSTTRRAYVFESLTLATGTRP
ncbi:class I SAM-dependent methyltransferase [Micromonospora sp. DT178]|uniref:class I SAM-dependent methyltransferase n=1 Tax=Micromonospora sp. DT178 TaxID=3393436 RepID=UPI003CEEDD9D